MCQAKIILTQKGYCPRLRVDCKGRILSLAGNKALIIIIQNKDYYILFLHLFCVCTCTHLLQGMCEGQKTNYRSPFSSSTMQVLESNSGQKAVAAVPYLLSYLPGPKGYFVLVIWNMFRIWVEFQALQSNVKVSHSAARQYLETFIRHSHTRSAPSWPVEGESNMAPILQQLIAQLGTVQGQVQYRVSCKAKYSDVRDETQSEEEGDCLPSGHFMVEEILRLEN